MEQMQIGPAGGNGGKPFDHYDVPAGARLTAIHVFTEWVLNAIQFDYVTADGQPDGRPPMGGLGGEHHVFYLDEDEYLIGISGRAGWYVDSLRFHTNKRVSAVYGGAGGDRDFSFLAPAGYEVSGLYGRSAWYVDALGVIVRRRAGSTAGVAAAAADDIAAADMAAADRAAGEIAAGDTTTADKAADDMAAADMAAADRADDMGDADALDDEPWYELSDAGQQVTASVVVRREVIATQEELDALEEAALAEVIAVIEGDEGDEGTVDVAVYTQVMDDEATGQTVAVVMAVAAEAGAGIEVVGDQPDEVAVMVTDAISSEDDIDALEEEAIDGAIATLLESADDDIAEVDVIIYAGASEDDSGQAYAAVVAIAGRAGASAAAAETAPTRAAPAADATRAPRSKDLELVEGIGPKIAELLISHDIYDLADLAAAPVERLREILGAAGRRFRLADPATWPEQARLGASGAWDALTELQSKLKAGRS